MCMQGNKELDENRNACHKLIEKSRTREYKIGLIYHINLKNELLTGMKTRSTLPVRNNERNKKRERQRRRDAN